MRTFTVYDIFQRNSRIHGDSPALREGAVSLTFRELLDQVDRLGAGLADAGIRKGDRIAVISLNHRHFFTLFGASARLGAVLVPINWRLSADEISYILKDAAPRLLFTDGNHDDKLRDIALPPELKPVFLDSGKGEKSVEEMMADGPPLRPAISDPETPLCVIYTAAVDGHPRGAVLSHGNLISANLQTVAAMSLDSRDIYLNMLPLFHITGLNLALAVLHTGGCNIVVPKFDEAESLRLTQAEGITLWGSFPPMLSRLTAEMASGKYDTASLRHVLGIDGPDNIRPFEEKTGATFWMLYGQTETSGLVSLFPAMERPGSAGRPGLLTHVRIVDENDRDMPPGETGEIAVQGPLVFQGFWRQEDSSLYTFRNEWHHTGDLGMMDADGYLWFRGRKPEKELIKPGGENVYPAEVEAAIAAHPAVEAVSVIGVPDPEFGEGVKAICVLRQGASVAAEELAEFVASRIARYKKPRYVEFVDELPRTSAGKVDRVKVKALYGNDGNA